MKIVSLLIIFIGVFLLVFGFLYWRDNGQWPEIVLPAVSVPEADVQGIATDRANEISGELFSDLSDAGETVQKDVFEVTIGDIFSSVLRLQQVPADIQNTRDSFSDYVGSVLESRKEK